MLLQFCARLVCFHCYLVSRSQCNCFVIVIIYFLESCVAWFSCCIERSTGACDITILKYIMWTVIWTSCLISYISVKQWLQWCLVNWKLPGTKKIVYICCYMLAVQMVCRRWWGSFRTSDWVWKILRTQVQKCIHEQLWSEYVYSTARFSSPKVLGWFLLWVLVIYRELSNNFVLVHVCPCQPIIYVRVKSHAVTFLRNCSLHKKFEYI